MNHDLLFAAFVLMLSGISLWAVVVALKHDPVVDCPEPEPGRIIIAVDFDGVLHSFTSGWCGLTVIPDEPIQGCFAWLERLVGHGMVVCVYGYRSRSRAGRKAMKQWMIEKGCHDVVMSQIHFPSHKPAAHITIDDRTYRFEGEHFPGPRWLTAFRPWWERIEDERVEGSKHGVLAGVLGCCKCGNDAVEFGWYDTGDKLARQRAHYYCRNCGQSHSDSTPVGAKGLWNAAQKEVV